MPVPPVVVTAPGKESHAEYRGGSTSAQAKLAFFRLGQVSLELIEPIGEPSTWNDQLVAHGESLHHIAFQIKGMDERVAALADLEIPLIQRGDYRGGRYAYLDATKRLGTVLELLEND
jgi:hypothetical protein